MKMWLDLLLLVIGFVLLLKGADVFVDGSAGVARIFKVPGVIIGLTIVAMGTSAPELAVSVSAGISGSNAIAVSNVVGSNIFNLLMVLGICAMMKALPVDSGIKKRDYPISLVATLILLFLAGNLFFVGKVPDYRNMNASGGVLYRWNGIILIALFVLYLAYTIYLAKKNKETENDEAKKMPMWQCLLYIILGLAAIIIGMAVGNVVGSNIFNLLLILGVSSAIHPIAISMASFVDLCVLLAVSLIAFGFVITGKRINRAEGFTMIVMYLAYTAFSIWRG